jgi:hypothetical protein
MAVESSNMSKAGIDDADHGAAGWRRSASLAAVAVGALLLGLLVYLTDRSSSSASLIPRVDALAGRHVFGAIGQWLPSFVHPFSFALLSAAALGARDTPRYGVCVAWCLIDVAFEIGQHPQVKLPLAQALQDGLGWTPLARPLADYFLRGTFDAGDIAAAVLGGLAACFVLRLQQPVRGTSHDA